MAVLYRLCEKRHTGVIQELYVLLVCFYLIHYIRALLALPRVFFQTPLVWLCLNLIALAVETWSSPLRWLQGSWCCRPWECFPWWDACWRIRPFGFVAATGVQRSTAVTKLGFGEAVICMYTEHDYLGTKRCYKAGRLQNLYLLQMCAEAHTWESNCFSSPRISLRCTYPFLLFHDAQRWPHSLFKRGGDFFDALRVPSLDITYNWVIIE